MVDGSRWRFAAGIWLAAAALTTLHAQQAPDPAAAGDVFAVASVKPSAPDSATVGFLPQPGGRLAATGMPLRLLVRVAFQLQDFQVAGGPAWIASERFDIIAAGGADSSLGTDAMMRPVRGLLADRFKLRVHTETRELPIYALVVAREDRRLGPQLRPSTIDCAAIGAAFREKVLASGKMPRPEEIPSCLNGFSGIGTMKADGMSLSMIVQLLTPLTGRQVVDQTGLTGNFSWELQFDPATAPGLPVAASRPRSDGPALMTALREQLGLELKSARGPVEVLVIDSVERPAPD